MKSVHKQALRRIGTCGLTATALAAVVASGLGAGTAAAAPVPTGGTAGKVYANIGLPDDRWVTGAGSANRFTYWTNAAADRTELSSAAIYLPNGDAPEGGWPVVAWAHDTVGLADKCAPSWSGKTESAARWNDITPWLKKGYAVVASDYAGLGTEGKLPDLQTTIKSDNIIDAVKAAHDIAPNLSAKWAVNGNGSGATAALATARNAVKLQGPDLDFRGATVTSVPADLGALVLNAGPGFIPVPLPTDLTAEVLYAVAGIRASHPEINLDSYLSTEGRALTDKAVKVCSAELQRAVAGTSLNELFTKPVASIPNLGPIVEAYLGVPDSGFAKPVFIGQGLLDTTVVLPYTLDFLNRVQATDRTATIRTYPVDGPGTSATALPDATAFVSKILGG
ncbi:MAG: lipase [Gordonia sp.]|uniref:Lipase n=1 Tax=Gordonia rubripertincta TaxID=36822 RepID=A0ABT4MNW2_GORRU|nr:lipase family protein [Gordonia rubripertincta]MBA4025265.1 lipase [Gordonia sp. (in: high G+C Gram-positive bacteria)]MCZ4548689.1 lipase [Gordonia rubripertincta]